MLKVSFIFQKKNITTKRPGDGISPFDIDKILKLKAKKNFLHDEKIGFSSFKAVRQGPMDGSEAISLR